MNLLFKNVEMVGVINGLSTRKATIIRRHSHTLIYKINGDSLYLLRGKEYHLVPKSLLFIPENETYSFQLLTQEDSKYYLINFHAETETALAPVLFTNLNSVNVLSIFRQMERSFLLGGQIGHLECMSLFYSLLTALAVSEEIPYTTNQQKTQIQPALLYLEDHLFDKDFKISVLPRLCQMSAPTFRRIFISQFGTTPKNYLIQHRLLYAEQILKSGEYNSIAELSARIGFEDPLYFSKCFKAYFGISPSKM